MGELWDIYDENRKKTGKTAERDVYQFKNGEYHIVVTGIILNSKNEILISKRAPFKRHGNLWECNGGSILTGETSIDGILRELREELGIKFDRDDAIFLKEVKRDRNVPDFKDLWLFQRDIAISEITFTDGEATEAKWVTIEKFMQMYSNKEIVPTVNFGEEEYQLALEKLRQKNIEKYYNNTESDKPSKALRYLIEKLECQPGKAIDLGCGAGNDTVYLIKNNWNVLAVDREDVEERIQKRLTQEQIKQFRFQRELFESIKLPECDLMVAFSSLSFCNKEKIVELWAKIKESIVPGGYFVGNFFGIHDSWAKNKMQMTFFDEKEINDLFKNFEIIKFKEIEEDGIIGLKRKKHWHIFILIAKKEERK